MGLTDSEIIKKSGYSTQYFKKKKKKATQVTSVLLYQIFDNACATCYCFEVLNVQRTEIYIRKAKQLC